MNDNIFSATPRYCLKNSEAIPACEKRVGLDDL